MRISTLFASASLALLFAACGGGGGGGSTSPQAPPAAPKLVYTDPTTGAYRLTRNATLSTDGHLVLDLLGPASGQGRGISLALTADAVKVQWAKVAASDADLALSPTFDLGTAPRIFKARQTGPLLEIALAQKGSAVASKPLSGPLVRVALDLKPGATGSVSLAAAKAQVLPGAGAAADIPVALGTLAIQ